MSSLGSSLQNLCLSKSSKACSKSKAVSTEKFRRVLRSLQPKESFYRKSLNVIPVVVV
jgi:hypothetical protein